MTDNAVLCDVLDEEGSETEDDTDDVPYSGCISRIHAI